MKKGPASMLSHRSEPTAQSNYNRNRSRLAPCWIQWRSLLVVAAAMWACVGAATPAVAAPVSVGLLGIDGASVEQGMGQALTDVLHRHIPSLQGMRVEKSQQDLVEVKLVFGCTDENPSCMAKVGKSLGVDRLIYGSIRKQPQGGLYTVAIKQLSVADSTVEKFITEAVPGEILKADNQQLDELVQRWLRVLLIEGLRGGLHVVTEPPGAFVQLDGIAVGQSPLTMQEVDVGDHLLRVELEGHNPMQRTIRIRGGQVHEVTAMLVRRGSGRSGTGGGTDVNRILKITSYVAAGLAGASFLATIGTWRGYVASEDAAGSSLDRLQRSLASSGKLGQYAGFFGSSAQLSGCGMVSGLQGEPDYRSYLDQCQQGNSLARATTGMWVATGTFAVISIATGLVAALRKPAGDSADRPVQIQPTQPAQPGPTQAAPAQTAPGDAPAPMAPAEAAPAQAAPTASLQLIGISPSVGPDGAAVAAAFRF